MSFDINTLTEEEKLERELMRTELIRKKDLQVAQIRENIIKAVNQMNEKSLLRYSGVCEQYYSQFTQEEILQMILERFGLGVFQLEKNDTLIDRD